MNKKNKNKPIKIRRTWDRNPAEKIKEDKEKPSSNSCDNCKLYLSEPEACVDCISLEIEQSGGE